MPPEAEGGQCPWRTLGVPRTATQAEVEAAYRRLALRYHPDLNHGCEHAAAQFRNAASAMHEIRAVGPFSAGNRSMRGASSSGVTMTPEFRYGAQYAQPRAGTGPGAYAAARARRRAVGEAPTGFKVAAFCFALLSVAAAVRMSLDNAERARATNAWEVRELNKLRDRAARPTHGKGRRRGLEENYGASKTRDEP